MTFADGTSRTGASVIAADSLHSKARAAPVGDEPVNAPTSPTGPVPIEQVRENDVSETDVVVYVGPRCHFVQYPLRGGEMFNQVAVFQSPKAVASEEDWGTPDELDAAFDGTCEQIQQGLPLMWRDRWWRMFDRNPIMKWVYGRIALLGDAAHPPLQYVAQGAIMAIEDGWVLAEHAAGSCERRADLDWDAALAAYHAVRPEHCRRVLTTGRAWGSCGTSTGQATAAQRDPAAPATPTTTPSPNGSTGHGPHPGPGARECTRSSRSTPSTSQSTQARDRLMPAVRHPLPRDADAGARVVGVEWTGRPVCRRPRRRGMGVVRLDPQISGVAPGVEAAAGPLAVGCGFAAGGDGRPRG